MATPRLDIRQVLGIHILFYRDEFSTLLIHVLRFGRLLHNQGSRYVHREILAIPVGPRRQLQSDQPDATSGRDHRSYRYVAEGHLHTQERSRDVYPATL